MHRHKEHTSRGPFGCRGNVSYQQICSCGAERHICYCHQCEQQGTDVGEWEMPICQACGKRHPKDERC